jgi:hypothetical protein
MGKGFLSREAHTIEHRHASVSSLSNTGADEDNNHAKVEEKDPSRPNEFHKSNSGESS